MKNEVFQLGLMLLEIGLGKSIQSVYNQLNGKFQKNNLK